MVGFFLPGDSLVFISGLTVATKPELMNVSILELNIGLIIAAITGNITGYVFGKRVGPALFNKEDNIIFKKKYVNITRSFYERHGGKSLILGRFLPIIRTFAPILAGVIKMNFKIFILYSIIGAILWISSLSVLGYYLGEIEAVRENVEWIVIFLIIVTLIPIAHTYQKEKKHAQKRNEENSSY
jgi:membrane-associated protein